MPWYSTPLGSVFLRSDEEAAGYREQPCVRDDPPKLPETTPRSVLDRILREDREDFEWADAAPRYVDPISGEPPAPDEL